MLAFWKQHVIMVKVYGINWGLEMTTAKVLCTTMAEALGLTTKFVEWYARCLREADLFPTGKGGRGGVNRAIVEPKDAVNLLLALMATDAAKDGPEAVGRYGRMLFTEVAHRYVTADGTYAHDLTEEVSKAGICAELAAPFGEILAGCLRDYKAGLLPGGNWGISRLLVNRSQPVAMFELSGHHNGSGDKAFAEFWFSGEQADDVETLMRGGTPPDRPISDAAVGFGLRTAAELPGEALEAIADCLGADPASSPEIPGPDVVDELLSGRPAGQDEAVPGAEPGQG